MLHSLSPLAGLERVHEARATAVRDRPVAAESAVSLTPNHANGAMQWWPLALVISLAVHGAALAWAASALPSQRDRIVVEQDDMVRAVAMDIVLPRAAPPPPPPSPVVIAEAPPPVVAPAAPEPMPKKRTRKRAAPTAVAPTAFESADARPAPAKVPAKMPAGPALPLAPGQGSVAVAAAPAAGGEAVTDQPIAPDALPGATDQDGVGFDLGGYGAGVRKRVARNQRYPAIAADEGWEGVCEVVVQIDRDGAIVGQPRVAKSAGYAALDREALRMVRAAAPFSSLPAGFRGRDATITLPIAFRLADDDF